MGDTGEAENSHRKLLTFYLAVISIRLLVGGLEHCRRTRSCLVIQGLFSEDDVKNKSEVSAAAWRKRASGSNSKRLL